MTSTSATSTQAILILRLAEPATIQPPISIARARMALIEVPSGLEGVIAFDTSIAEPDREGGALRYRGVDIEELVGNVPYEKVWGLLVDGQYDPGLPPAEPHPLSVRTGDPRVDLQAALAMLAPGVGPPQLIDISDEQARDDLARVSVMALSFVAQSARGVGRPPIPQAEVDKATSIPERFLIRWRGEADPRHVKAIDAYWISAAEHGMNASTFTARVIASTGRRRGRGALGSGRRACPARCTAAHPRACCTCSTRWRPRVTPSAGSSRRSTAATG